MIEFMLKVTLLLSLAGSLSFFPRMVSAELRSGVSLVSFAAVLVLLAAMLAGTEVTIWHTSEALSVEKSVETSAQLSPVLPVPQSAVTSAIAPSQAWSMHSLNSSVFGWIFSLGALLLLLRTAIQTWRCHRFVSDLRALKR